MLQSAKELRGYSIQARDGGIGCVDDIYFDDGDWLVRYVVVDTGGWITGKKVIVSPDVLEGADSAGRRLLGALTRRQVENSPDVMTEPTVAVQHMADAPYFQGWPAYWGPGSFLIPTWKAPPVINPDTEHPEEPSGEDKPGPHLRSGREISGYRVQARDDTIGHVEDVLLDPETWAIRYVVMDTRNWLSGKKVLLSWRWVDKVRWSTRKLHVDLLKAQILDSPAYRSPLDVTREYEAELQRHYGEPESWRSAGR